MSLLLLLSSVSSPFNQSDWPVARAIDYPVTLRTWLQGSTALQLSISYMPGRVEEWGDPKGPVWYDLTWTPGSSQALLAPPVVGQPFVQTDWPLPRSQPTSLTYTQSSNTPLFSSAIPIFPRHSPQPRPVRVVDNSYVQSSNFWLFSAANYMPGRVSDWGSPRGPQPDAQTWLQPTNIALTTVVATPPPIAQYNWPLPRAIQYPDSNRTWLFNPIGLFPAITYMPGRVTTWPTPTVEIKAQAWTAPNTISLLTAAAATPPPIAQYDWPLPRAAHYPSSLRTWIFNPIGLFPVVTYMPGRVEAFGTPVGPEVIAQTWLQPTNIPLTTAVAATRPISQYDWPLPKVASRQADLGTWTNQAIQVGYVFRAEVVARQPSPPPQIVFNFPNTIPLLTATPAVKPPVQYNWPLPAPAKRAAEPFSPPNIVLNAPVTQVFKPGTVTDWGPALRVQIDAQTWLPPNIALTAITYIFCTEVVSQPRPPERPIPSGIQSSNMNLLTAVVVTLPYNRYDWPLPTTAVFPTSNRTWLSATAALLTPVVPRPFFQTSWPLPQAQTYPDANCTWISATAALLGTNKPLGQYDWPQPQAAKYPDSNRTWVYSNPSYMPPPPVPPPFVPLWRAADPAPFPIANRTWVKFVPQFTPAQQPPPPFVPLWTLPPVAVYPNDNRTWAHAQALSPFVPSPELPNVPRPFIRDYWDIDAWGRLHPGSCIRRG